MNTQTVRQALDDSCYAQDRHGNRRKLNRGEFVRDGESLVRPFHMLDSAAAATPDRKRELVADKLGEHVVAGKPQAFIDAAYRTLMTDPQKLSTMSAQVSDQIGLTDAERTRSQRGINAALRDAAADRATAIQFNIPVSDVRQIAPNRDQVMQDGKRAASNALWKERMSNAWKGDVA